MVSKKGSSNYLVKVNGQRYETSSIRRFYNHIRTIKWGSGTLAYLRVSYGKDKDIHGKIINFYNDGEYTNKKEFGDALNAFLET
jgi:hypothetical protein